uniref:Uncharacterized protein n=1 Tax=Arundo donax TaxID=35708 RepID=A0A0A9U6V2_ARUDO
MVTSYQYYDYFFLFFWLCLLPKRLSLFNRISHFQYQDVDQFIMGSLTMHLSCYESWQSSTTS